MEFLTCAYKISLILSKKMINQQNLGIILNNMVTPNLKLVKHGIGKSCSSIKKNEKKNTLCNKDAY